jgi:radical SAM protein with 4Fe4S-binding SPASM domain
VDRITAGLPDLESVALQVNGEPLLHPELPAIVRLLAGRGLAVELNTNAIELDAARARALIDAGLGRLNVSLDGVRRGTYARLRGIDALDRVVGNLGDFLRLRGPAPAAPRVSLWMVATRRNLPELPELVDLAARVGADEVYLQRLVVTRGRPGLAGQSLHGDLPQDLRAILAEAETRAARSGVALAASGGHTPARMLADENGPEPWRGCRRPSESAVVMAGGEVVPCCIATFVAPLSQIRLGNLKDGLLAVWTGAAYEAFRQQLREGEAPPHCQNCGVRWSL